MYKLHHFTVCILIGLLAACTSSQSTVLTPEVAYGVKPVYNYPIANPYAATVITTPVEMRVDYSMVPQPVDHTITLFPDRVVPDGFWYERGLKYSTILQPKPAPLVYIIPGTGADYHAALMLTLARIAYNAGYSAVLLPSPTNPNFIINASEHFLPGSPVQDATDLLRLMQAIDAKIALNTSVKGHLLMGYSLGAWEAAFTAKLDNDGVEKGQGGLNFQKVVMVNPPFSLYSSMGILDNDLGRSLPHGMDDASAFIQGFIARLSAVSTSGEAFDFQNQNLLLDAYNKYHPSDDRLATTIGLSFRLSAADMAFTSDIMRHSNYIFPSNQPFTSATDLNVAMAIALRTSFNRYLSDVFFEEQHKEHPNVTKQDLIDASSLQSLASYIQGNPKMFMLTNRDDIILAPGEIDQLMALFGENAVIFPSGGHLGNIEMPAVAWYIIHFMKQ